MKTIFTWKNYLISNIILLFLFATSWYMANQGFLREALGNCTPACPPGAICTLVIYYCSEMAGRFLLQVIPLFFVVFTITFAAIKYLNKSK